MNNNNLNVGKLLANRDKVTLSRHRSKGSPGQREGLFGGSTPLGSRVFLREQVP